MAEPAGTVPSPQPALAGGGRRCRTVALIGPDGAGKTAVAQRLLASCPLPLKYLYMGISIESSNVALPTSRLIHRLKVWRFRRVLRQTGQPIPSQITLHGLSHRTVQRGKLAAAARLVSRIAEQSYRQCVSWFWQLRGNIVLYDRHFLFDCCPCPAELAHRPLSDRLNCWFLRRAYPRPDLVAFLDAPVEMLYARKQEVSREYLEENRAQLLAQREFVPRFCTIDAGQPLEQVVAEVQGLILQHCALPAVGEPGTPEPKATRPLHRLRTRMGEARRARTARR